MTADRPKPFTFLIRGLQMTTVVERMFHVETAAERAAWLEAIQVMDIVETDIRERNPILPAQGVKGRLEKRPAEGMLGEELQEQVSTTSRNGNDSVKIISLGKSGGRSV